MNHQSSFGWGNAIAVTASFYFIQSIKRVSSWINFGASNWCKRFTIQLCYIACSYIPRWDSFQRDSYRSKFTKSCESSQNKKPRWRLDRSKIQCLSLWRRWWSGNRQWTTYRLSRVSWFITYCRLQKESDDLKKKTSRDEKLVHLFSFEMKNGGGLLWL